MRRTLLAVAVVAGLVAGTSPSWAKDIARVPVCDGDGHCDRHCTVKTDPNFVECGVRRVARQPWIARSIASAT